MPKKCALDLEFEQVADISDDMLAKFASLDTIMPEIREVKPDVIGGLFYIPNFLNQEQTEILKEYCIREIPFHEFKIRMYNREVTFPRLLYAMRDVDYSGYIPDAHQKVSNYTNLLQLIERNIGRIVGNRFNVGSEPIHFPYCEFNYYRDYNDTIGKHRDRECQYGQHVVGLTLGHSRRLNFYDNDKQVIGDFYPQSGSLYIMHQQTCNSTRFKHGIPALTAREKKRVEESGEDTARICITFRESWNGKHNHTINF